MTKMRENTGVILWILVVAFGVIWVLQDAGTFETMGQQTNDIITVNGNTISVQEYNRAVQNRVQQIEQRTGETLSPQRRDMVREQVYDALVEDQLRQEEMDRLGITVTDDEVYEMVMGENPHPLIKRQFGNEQGGVDRALLQNFIDNPETKQQWIQIEQALRSQRRQEKLNRLMEAAVHVSEQDIKEEYMRRNRTASADYVALRYASVPNDSVQVTEDDLRSYYDENRDDFKQEKTYALEYVTLSKNPTAQDTATIRREVESLREEFAKAENDSLFLQRNASAQSYTSSWQGRDDLMDEVAQAVFENPEPGRIVGPITAGGQMHLVKIKDVRSAENPVIRARHILLRTNDNNAEAMRTQAQNLKERIQQGEATFAEMARQYSDDGTASQGGDLGWFGEGRMVPAFEEAALNADIGEVVGPVETRFGYHLIKVKDRANQEVKIADYALDVRPNTATLRDLRTKLEDLAYFTEESGNFAQEAKRLDLDVQQMQVEAEQTTFPNLGRSTRLADFLKEADPGEVSDIIELDDRYLVAFVSSTKEAGHRSFEKVKSEIRPRVLLQKKRQVQVRRLERANQQAGSLQQLSQAVGAPVQQVSGVTMAEPTIQGLGREPKFVGTAMGLDEGETSGVVEGENAAYVLEVTNVQDPPPLTEVKRQQLRQELKQKRQQQLRTEWIAGLREQAEIRDNRARFRQ